MLNFSLLEHEMGRFHRDVDKIISIVRAQTGLSVIDKYGLLRRLSNTDFLSKVAQGHEIFGVEYNGLEVPCIIGRGISDVLNEDLTKPCNVVFNDATITRNDVLKESMMYPIVIFLTNQYLVFCRGLCLSSKSGYNVDNLPNLLSVMLEMPKDLITLFTDNMIGVSYWYDRSVCGDKSIHSLVEKLPQEFLMRMMAATRDMRCSCTEFTGMNIPLGKWVYLYQNMRTPLMFSHAGKRIPAEIRRYTLGEYLKYMFLSMTRHSRDINYAIDLPYVLWDLASFDYNIEDGLLEDDNKDNTVPVVCSKAPKYFSESPWKLRHSRLLYKNTLVGKSVYIEGGLSKVDAVRKFFEAAEQLNVNLSKCDDLVVWGNLGYDITMGSGEQFLPNAGRPDPFMSM